MPHPLTIEPILRNALLEDLGHGNDVTSENIIPPNAEATAVMRARSRGVIAGTRIAEMVFQMVDPSLETHRYVTSGEAVLKNKELLSIQGSAQSILAAERVALNFISHLSGIATATAAYVKETKGTKAKICCTRKTLPGLRSLQKYAVLAGGGANHRFGLDDAILIKDNHIAAAGGIRQAIEAAQNFRANYAEPLRIEVETRTLEEVDEVLAVGGIDVIMLDNMAVLYTDGPLNISMLSTAVERIDKRFETEASGNVTEATVGAIAASGVDAISSGALTHSVKALDISLKVELHP